MYQRAGTPDTRYPVGTEVEYEFGGFTTRGTVIAVDFNSIKIETSNGVRVVKTTLSSLHTV